LHLNFLNQLIQHAKRYSSQKIFSKELIIDLGKSHLKIWNGNQPFNGLSSFLLRNAQSFKNSKIF
jgi:hypothetical protein